MKSEEIEEILKNTPTHQTARSELIVLDDLFDGLIKSDWGFRPEQNESERRALPFLVIDKSKISLALNEICSERYHGFCPRMVDDQYENGKLGYHPSRILTKEDFIKNPSLIGLLMGEFWPSSGLLFCDIGEAYSYKNCGRQGVDFGRIYDSEESALDFGKSVVAQLPDLCKPAREVIGINNSRFNYEWIPCRFDLRFEHPHLYLNNSLIYQLSTRNLTRERFDFLQQNLKQAKNQKAKAQMEIGIKEHEERLSAGKARYSAILKFR